MERLLDGLAARGGDVEAPPEQHRQLAAIAGLGLLHPDRQPLEDAAELQRGPGVERDVDADRQQRQHEAAILAEKLEPADRSRHLEQLLADEEQRGEDAEHAHGKAERAAGHALDRVLDALLDIVGRAGRCAARRIVLEMEVRVVGVEKRGIEAAVQPAAPFAVQRSRKKMPHADQACILEQHQQDQRAGVGQKRRQRPRIVRPVEIGDRGDELAGGFGEPDPGLAVQRREPDDDRRQGPGLPPAVGHPVGPHQPPEAPHLGDGRQRRRPGGGAVWLCR